MSHAAVESFFLDAESMNWGFADAVVISGLDARQLRNALERNVLTAGSKHRSGRWTFSLEECFYLLIVAQLTKVTYMPISDAAAVANQIAPYVKDLHAEYLALSQQPDNDKDATHFIIDRDENGPRVRVLRGTVAAPKVYGLDGSTAGDQFTHHAHIRLRLINLLVDLVQGIALATANDRAQS